MKMIRRIFCLLFICMVVVFGQAFLVSAGEIVGHYVENPEAALSYWTPERMKNAIPAMPMLEGAPSPEDAVAAEEPFEEPGLVTSSKDGTSSVLLTGDEAAIMALSGAIDLQADGYDTYPPPENTYPIPMTWYGSFPIRAVGKVYFSDGTYNYVCSGSSIGGRGVLTAGHCVSDGAGNWYINWVFKPAWRDPWAPYGTWVAYIQYTFTVWHDNGIPGGLCRDVGGAKVNDIGGLMLSQTVGYLGFSWNASRLQHWSIHGYPAAAPWVGKIQVKTGASYSRTDAPGCVDDIPSGTPPNPTGVGWRQTGGASGGPWIKTYRPQQWGANNYANGVNSYIYGGTPLRIYGPYFDTSVKDLRDMLVAP